MGKQRGNFIRKIMAVLLMTVLCVSLTAGGRPVEVWAEDNTQTVRLILTFSDDTSIDADMITGIGLVDPMSGEVYHEFSVSKYDDKVIYEIAGLERGKSYRWIVCGYALNLFSSDSAVVESTVVLHRVKYWDGDDFVRQDYVPDGQGVYYQHLPLKKEGYSFLGWVPRKDGDTEIEVSTYTYIYSPTDMIALWQRESELTNEEFEAKVREILITISVSKLTTKEMFANAIKKEMDDYFLISVDVNVADFRISNEENILHFLIDVSYKDFYFDIGGDIGLSEAPLPPQDRGWTLDREGNLTITSQAGMEDWVQNGRTESNLLNVKHVLIQDGVSTIPSHAFSGCGNLGSVSISGTVTDIGDSAFAGAASLEKVVMQGVTPPAVGSGVFDDCKFVTDSVGGILVPPGSGDAYKQELGGTLGTFITEGSLTVTEEALRNKLQQVLANLPVSNDSTMDEVRSAIKKEIDGYFQINSTITVAGFTLEGATTEGEGSLKLEVMAGYGGTSVSAETVISIPQLLPLPDRGWTLDQAGNLTITSQAGMEDWAQNGRAEGSFPKVKNILIGSGVTAIPEDAFSGCADLVTVVISDTVVSIGSQAFANAFSLGEITLPAGLQGIGDGAFMNCDNLGKVVMQGTTPPSLGSSVFDQCKFTTDDSRGIVVPSGSGDAYRAAWGALGDHILEKHTHSFGADWKYDGMYHWHECACGGKGDVSAHDWGNGVIEKAPTATEAGIMGYSCSSCQATKTESIPATGTDTGNNPGGDGSGTGSNPGGDGSVSGNNPGGDGSVSGNNPGGDPSEPGSNPGGDPSSPGSTPGGGTPGPGGSSGGNPSGSGSGYPDGDSAGSGSSDSGLSQPETAGNGPLRDREPRTADSVPMEMYATIAMIAGFFYLILLFLDRYDITEEERRESLARLVRWAKRGGWFRRLPVMAVLYTMRLYYHMTHGQEPKGRKI